MLELKDESGEQITDNQYFERALVEVKGKSKDARSKNEIRENLKTFFQHRFCFTFCQPAET